MATAQPSIILTSKERARFEAFVDRTPGQGPHGTCSEFTGYRNQGGYGVFGLRGKLQLAHRVAYLSEHGEWPTPKGLHECDNPPCCEAAHIFEGTDADNAADRDSKGRTARGDANGRRTHPERYVQNRPRGESHGRAKFSDETIQAVRVATGSQREIGRRFGVSKTHVRHIKHGETRT